MQKTKRRMFGFHLALSMVLCGVITAWVVFAWFPPPFVWLDGTWFALGLIVGIDLILGPLITLIVASDKKSLKATWFDFSVVLSIQLAALFFGLFQMQGQRIYALAYMDNEFQLINSSQVLQKDYPSGLPRYNGISYGAVVLGREFAGLSYAETVLKLGDMSLYQTLSKPLNGRRELKKEYVPVGLWAKYGDDAIYKLIIGKKRNAVAALNEQMEIMDIQLLEQAIDMDQLLRTHSHLKLSSS